MWPSIRHWLDSLMRDHLRLTRVTAQPQALHFAWERAGHVVSGQAIAWCAEAVTIEALVRLPAPLGRNKTDFTVRVGQGEPIPADQLRRVENDDRHRAVFRLTPLAKTTVAEVLFRGKLLGQLTLPVLSREEYIRQLRLEMPAVYVRLGGEAIAAQTFVSGQSRGIMASAVLSSPVGLVPLVDLEVEVEFRCESSGAIQRVPARLSASQMSGKTALVSVAPPRSPRRQGLWMVTWRVGGEALAQQQIRAITQRTFERSLRISDTRFVVQGSDGRFRLCRQAPPRDSVTRLGPCFLVASNQPGMAGLCRLRVVAHVSGTMQPPLLQEVDVLVSDGPAMVAPGTLDTADLAQVSGFELTSEKGTLGLLPLCPAPSATFTAEGGFRPPPEYTWTAAAEEEMQDRLNRLLGD